MSKRFLRRDFLKMSLFGLGAAILSACKNIFEPVQTLMQPSSSVQSESDRVEYPGANPVSTQMHSLPKVAFGNTGLQVSRLSFGTGSNGWQGRSDQSDLGVDNLAGLLKLGFENGINFWDTADAYGTHPHVAKALQDIPRDDVVILTKTLSQREMHVKRDVERFLKELDTDYIDVLLLHVMTHADWPRRYADAMEVLTRAKRDGKVRALGVSCHSIQALQTAAETDWCEVVMARINYAGVNMDAAPEKIVPILNQMYTSGKAVFGMKIVGNGHLLKDVRAAIQYVLELGTVHAITIGMTNLDQLAENLQLVSDLSP